MDLFNLISLGGVAVVLGSAVLLSRHRRQISLRTLAGGMGIMTFMAVFVFLFPLGSRLFLWLNGVVLAILEPARAGMEFCFGPLAFPPGSPGSVGFILVFQALPTIIFFAALVSLLYHIGLMPRLIRWFSWLFARLMKTSGAESLCASSNVFVGIEAVTTIRPYLDKMTPSELCTVLTAGLATIASSVLGTYVLLLHQQFPNIAAHLISASFLSAPAAIVLSKLLVPETGTPETLGVETPPEYHRASGLMDAILQGANSGARLLVGVVVTLIAFVGLIALLNLGIESLAHWVAGVEGLSIDALLAYVFYPFTVVLGVPPTDAWHVATLLGERLILTEVPAYIRLGELMAQGAFVHPRSAVIAAYALCGFAHIPSLAIFVGGITALSPGTTRGVARIALQALLAAVLACLLTAALAGVFFGMGTGGLLGRV